MTIQLCDYGCGQEAKYTTKRSRKDGPFKGSPVHKCSKSHHACPAIKQLKIQTSVEKYGTEYPWQTKEIIEKKKQISLEKYGTICSLNNPIQQEKRKKTMLERYGVKEPTQNIHLRNKAAAGMKLAHKNDPTLTVRQHQTQKQIYGQNMELVVQKVRSTRVARGDWVDPLTRTEWQEFKRQVEYHTYRNYRKLKQLINPLGLTLGRKTYQLDHIYSRKAGFENKIDPKIISHPANLRVIPAQENRLKQGRCDHTIEELQKKIAEWLAPLDSIDSL